MRWPRRRVAQLERDNRCSEVVVGSFGRPVGDRGARRKASGSVHSRVLAFGRDGGNAATASPSLAQPWVYLRRAALERTDANVGKLLRSHRARHGDRRGFGAGASAGPTCHRSGVPSESSATRYPWQAVTGSRGYFGRRRSSRERSHSQNTDPREERTTRAKAQDSHSPGEVREFIRNRGAVHRTRASIAPTGRRRRLAPRRR